MVRENKTECKMTFRNEEPHVNKGFPRVRGDVPFIVFLIDRPGEFSPRARGCSVLADLEYRIYQVFPACAGMFLAYRRPSHASAGFPRVRGDVPASVRKPFLCSSVFPACAGMFRSAKCNFERRCCFPRVRGDVPDLLVDEEVVGEFSPRARGCSRRSANTAASSRVFPACAGMFPYSLRPWPPRNCFPRVRGDVP